MKAGSVKSRRLVSFEGAKTLMANSYGPGDINTVQP